MSLSDSRSGRDDVTPRGGQDEAALLKAVVETVVDGIITIDENGLILTANPAVEQIFGYAPSELFGQNVKMLMPSPYREEHDAYLQNYLDTGHRRIIGIGREVSGMRKNGEIFPLDLAVSETQTDRGRIFTGIVRDISERKRVEEELRSERALLKAVVDTAVDGIITIGQDGLIKTANPATQTIFGYSAEELIGSNVKMLMPSPYHEEHDQYLANFLESGTPKIIGIGREVHGLRKNGEIFPMDLAVSETQTEAGLIFTGIVRDISDRKRAAELALARDAADRANAAKSEFLSRMSHELRTPMNSILGYAQLLELDVAEEKHKHYLERILKGGRHLLGLINEVLELSRIESSQLDLSIKSVAIKDVTAETVLMLSPLATSLNVQLIDNTADSSVHVIADLQRLRQVMLNLISNAIKYNREGGLVTISERVQGGTVRVEIADSGVGIPEDMVSRLFSPFERLGATFGSVEGTGLGLSVSRKLCEAMGGTIEYAPNPLGHGSVFAISLPLADARMDSVDQDMARTVIPAQLAIGKRTVLYVEDNLSNVELIRELLERFENVELLVAMQGGIGLELARQHVPHLVLLDLHLPDVNGAEILAEMKRTDALSHIPVIVLSADATKRQLERLTELGAHAFLTKPFNIPELLDRMRELFNDVDGGP
jgi:PAS domain S-box-containing protein